MRFTATVSDRPGGIAKLTEAMAEAGFSIKDIYHERAWLHSRVDQVQVKCVCETLGTAHRDEGFAHLRGLGYDISSEWEST